MRSLQFALILGLLLSVACGSQKQQAVVIDDQSVQLSVYAIHEYCGGIPPTDEILEELQRPRPYTDTLYIHPSRDIQRDTLLFTIVPVKGQASLPGIQKGDYVVFNQRKINAVETPEMDELTRCRIMTSSNPFFSFSIEEGTKLVADTVPVTCDPCIPPMP